MNSQSHRNIDFILAQIRDELDMSSETEHELLSEIRTHLEDAVAEAAETGEDETAVLQSVAARFGVQEVGQALQDVHAPWESADAIIASIIPVVGTLILRWIVFSPDGSAIGWQELLVRPAFWIVAIAALLIPALQFQRWRYALVSWGFFWAITVIFITLPTIQSW